MNIEVSTTLPVIGADLPLPIITDRLILRPYNLSDLEAYHSLVSEPEAMENGPVSPDLYHSELLLKENLPPIRNELLPGISFFKKILLGIFLKKSDGSEGDLIGEGGVGTLGPWPELGYCLKKEYWNKRYATEFTIAYMRFWWRLPRQHVVLQVDPWSVNMQYRSEGSYDPPGVVERVYARVKVDNKASARVLKKAGFESFENLDKDMTHWRDYPEAEDMEMWEIDIGLEEELEEFIYLDSLIAE